MSFDVWVWFVVGLDLFDLKKSELRNDIDFVLCEMMKDGFWVARFELG